MHSQEEIRASVEEWARAHMPEDYRFRPHQLESIAGIIAGVLDLEKSIKVIEAPTGAGKSLICLIAAGVLADVYRKSSFILVSDLYLWSQYEDAIARYSLPFGRLKGTVGNYVCDANGKDFKLGTCRVKSIPYSKLYDSGWCRSAGYACALSCDYVQSRMHASRAGVTLMTYQLWLGQMCNQGEDAEFKARDVVFCDECHNIPDIVQAWASPVLSRADDHLAYSRVFDALKAAGGMGDYESASDFIEPLNDLYERMVAEEDKDALYQELKDYARPLDGLLEAFEKWKRKLGRGAADAASAKALYAGIHLESQVGLINTYVSSIGLAGTEYMIKQAVLGEKGAQIKIQCAKEDLLVHEYLLSRSSHYAMLSATVGSITSFKESIGHAYVPDVPLDYGRIPSMFDFSNSPIIYMRGFDMSYGRIDDSMPGVANAVANIVSSPMFIGERGIIHTGSYLNSQKLYRLLPMSVRERCLYYSNSKEKDEVLQQFMDSGNKILMGPTLTEGIDLKDDLCRFLIIAKAPFPQLKDKLVEAKKKLYPAWYKSTTNNSIIQAIGRGNRHETDWCWSFILDQSFHGLLLEEIYKAECQYPPEFLGRLYEYADGNYVKAF